MDAIKPAAAIVLALCTASCATGGQGTDAEFTTVDAYYYANPVAMPSVDDYYAVLVPRMDPGRKVSEQDCGAPFAPDGGNLRCR